MISLERLFYLTPQSDLHETHKCLFFVFRPPACRQVYFFFPFFISGQVTFSSRRPQADPVASCLLSVHISALFLLLSSSFQSLLSLSLYPFPMATPSRPKPQRRAEPATRLVSPSNISPAGSHSFQKQPSPGMDRGKSVANVLPCQSPCPSPKWSALQSGGLPPIGWCQWLSSSRCPTGSHHSVPSRSYSTSNYPYLKPVCLTVPPGYYGHIVY